MNNNKIPNEFLKKIKIIIKKNLEHKLYKMLLKVFFIRVTLPIKVKQLPLKVAKERNRNLETSQLFLECDQIKARYSRECLLNNEVCSSDWMILACTVPII